MEQFFTTLLPIIGPGGIGVLAAVYVYLKIKNQRKTTGQERTKDSIDIHDTLLKHSFEINKLKDDMVLHNTVQQDLQHQITILSEATAKLSISVEHFSESVHDLKEEIRELRGRK